MDQSTAATTKAPRISSSDGDDDSSSRHQCHPIIHEDENDDQSCSSSCELDRPILCSVVTSQQPTAPSNPWPKTKPYHFSRDAEETELRRLLRIHHGPHNHHHHNNNTSNSRSSHRPMILVTGPSGAGKSQLVASVLQGLQDETTNSCHDDNEYYFSARGKFDARRGIHTTWMPLVRAISDVTDQVLSRWTASERSRWIQENVLESHHAQLLLELLPLLQQYVLSRNRHDTSKDSNNSRSSNGNNHSCQGTERMIQLRQALCQFMQALCRAAAKISEASSVVLFLDDLQWADSETLPIIAALLLDQQRQSRDNDKHNNNTTHSSARFQIIGACRSNEVALDSDLSTMLRNIEDAGQTIHEIPLADLSPAAVGQLVAGSSGLSTKACASVAQVLHQTARGNLMYTLELLRSLREIGAIFVATSVLECDWDRLDSFRSSLSEEDAVADMISWQMRKLTVPIQEALALAAYMGTSFDPQLVCLALEMDDFDQREWRHTLQDHPGLVAPIIPTNNLNSSNIDDFHRNYRNHRSGHAAVDYHYQFCHDKVQKACFNLVEPSQRPAFWLHAGRNLWHALDATHEIENHSVLVTHLMAQSLELIRDDPKERVLLANLFFCAGRRLLLASCFRTALDKLQAARSLLPPRYWRDCYNLVLPLFVASAEAEQVVGNSVEAGVLADEVIAQARTSFDSIHAGIVKINSLCSLHRFEEGLNVGFQYLKLFHIHFPKKPAKLQVALGFYKTRNRLKKFSTANILELPTMTCPKKRAAMEILAQMFTCAYICKSPTQSHIAMAMIHLTLEYGLNEVSANGFAIFSAMMCTMTNDTDSAYQYGHLAIRLLDRFGVQSWAARVHVLVYGVAMTNMVPSRKVVEPLLEGYRMGLSTGDTVCATISLYLANLFRFFGQESIETLLQVGQEYRKVLSLYRHASVLTNYESLLQSIENFMGRTEDPLVLNGSFMNEEEVATLHRQQNNMTGLQVLTMFKLILAFTFNDYRRCEAIYDELQREGCAQTIYSKCTTTFFGIAAKLILARQETSRRRKRVAESKRGLAFLRQKAEKTPENHQHKVYFLEALLLVVIPHSKQHDRALSVLDRAEDWCEREGALLHRATVVEHKARLLWDSSQEDKAVEVLRQAQDLFRQWGAQAKVDALELDSMLLLRPWLSQAMQEGKSPTCGMEMAPLALLDQQC